jgi:hypothetical protein
MSKRKQLPVNLLEFDRHNPRLVSSDVDLQRASDQVIMCELVKNADIGELITSISTNTYLDIEPLIVTQKDTLKPGNYRVLEGNRRLCAIRFLQKPEIARDCRLSMPKDISQDVLDSIQEVSVYGVNDEQEARAFIGFKHINGAHRWESYAKARFIAQWYQDEYKQGITVEDIANKLGDENQQVRSLLSAMLVLQQAEERELFDIQDRTKPGPFGFSHLYTALGRIPYREFIGLEKDWNQQPEPNPVDKEKLDNLAEVLTYIYGSKRDDKKSLIKSQNPDLANLGNVLANSAALHILRTTHDLSEALDRTRDGSQVFRDALIIAHSRVSDAFSKVNQFKPNESDDDLYNLADEMQKTIENLQLIMQKSRA